MPWPGLWKGIIREYLSSRPGFATILVCLSVNGVFMCFYVVCGHSFRALVLKVYSTYKTVILDILLKQTDASWLLVSNWIDLDLGQNFAFLPSAQVMSYGPHSANHCLKSLKRFFTEAVGKVLTPEFWVFEEKLLIHLTNTYLASLIHLTLFRALGEDQRLRQMRSLLHRLVKEPDGNQIITWLQMGEAGWEIGQSRTLSHWVLS